MASKNKLTYYIPSLHPELEAWIIVSSTTGIVLGYQHLPLAVAMMCQDRSENTSLSIFEEKTILRKDNLNTQSINKYIFN